MKFIVIKNNLKEGLDGVSRSIGNSSHLPILQNVLIEASENRIKLTATNLEIASSFYVPGKIIEHGSVTAPLGILGSLLGALSLDRLNFETKENSMFLTADNYRAEVKGAPSDEFPLIPKIKKQTFQIGLKGDVLKEALERVVVATQFSDLRPELNSVFLVSSEDGIRVVSTDSFRLGLYTMKKNLYEHEPKEGGEASLLIPLKTAHELVRIIKDEDKIVLQSDGDQMLIKAERFELISRLLQGSFPDYEPIIPKSFASSGTVPREEFLNAVRLASTFSSQNEVRVKLSPQKKALQVSSLNQAIGENTYLLPSRLQGDEVELGFNWRYLLDGLKAIQGDEVFFGATNDVKPALLKSPKDEGYLYVLMPIFKS